MQLSINQLRLNARTRSPALRALLWLCTIAFAIQLLAAATHRHDIAERLHDCVSCHLSAQLHTGVPPALPALPAPLLQLSHAVPHFTAAPFFAAPSYLIPPRQAPPRHLSFSH